MAEAKDHSFVYLVGNSYVKYGGSGNDFVNRNNYGYCNYGNGRCNGFGNGNGNGFGTAKNEGIGLNTIKFIIHNDGR